MFSLQTSINLLEVQCGSLNGFCFSGLLHVLKDWCREHLLSENTRSTQGKLDWYLQGIGAQYNVKTRNGKVAKPWGSVKQYQSLGMEGARSTGGLDVLGRVCGSLAAAVWCQLKWSSCFGYFAADLADRNIRRKGVRSLLGQRLETWHRIWEEMGKKLQDRVKICLTLPGVFGFLLSFQSHDHLEEMQFHPVCRGKK